MSEQLRETPIVKLDYATDHFDRLARRRREVRMAAIGMGVWGFAMSISPVALCIDLMLYPAEFKHDPLLLWFVAVAAVMGPVTLFAAWNLWKIRRRRFCLVVSIVNVFCIGGGTIFGGIALWVLVRPGTIELFEGEKERCRSSA